VGRAKGGGGLITPTYLQEVVERPRQVQSNPHPVYNAQQRVRGRSSGWCRLCWRSELTPCLNWSIVVAVAGVIAGIVDVAVVGGVASSLRELREVQAQILHLLSRPLRQTAPAATAAAAAVAVVVAVVAAA
jgi:hypothetical protein